MRAEPWTLVEPATPVEGLLPCTLLVFTATEAVLLSLRAEGATKLVVSPQPTSGWGGQGWFRQPPPLDRSVTLADVARESLGLAGARVLLLPAIVRRWTSAGKWGMALSSGLVTAFLATWAVLNPVSMLVALPGVALGTPFALMALFTHREVVGQREHGTTLESLPAWARRLEAGEIGPATYGEPSRPAATAEEAVDRVRQEYGRLRSDLAYRLENPALFDSATPPTAAFEAALADYQDAPSRETANRVEVRFNLARQHAERVGFGHVDDGRRQEVERAAKVARLLAGASSEGERGAAMAQLQRILDSLALYYLPARADHPELGW